MRLPSVRGPALEGGGELPLWPPLLATRGVGSRSELHAHHALHLVLALDGKLRTRTSATAPWTEAAGVLTPRDLPSAHGSSADAGGFIRGLSPAGTPGHPRSPGLANLLAGSAGRHVPADRLRPLGQPPSGPGAHGPRRLPRPR